VRLSKPPKVVPIGEDKRQPIARDQKAQRIILGIGSKRIPFDFFSRITHLPPHTGDRPPHEKETEVSH